MTDQLDQYQIDGAAFLAAHHRASIFDEPGLGKTAQAIRARELVRAERSLVICPAGVRQVWPYQVKLWGRDNCRVVKADSVFDMVAWQRGKVDMLVMSYEQATMWHKDLSSDFFDCLMIDECFPANTLVSTPLGRMPIGEIVDKKLDVLVFSQGRAIEAKPITRYIRKTTKTLLRVKHKHGYFDCTPNHKIWTENRSYVRADDLRAGDTLRIVRQRLHKRRKKKGAVAALLFETMFSEVALSGTPQDQGPPSLHAEPAKRQAAPRRLGSNEVTEFTAGVSRQTGQACEVAERQVVDWPEGRERFHNRTTKTVVRSNGIAAGKHGARNCDPPGVAQVCEFAKSLQSRCSYSRVTVGDRGRWRVSPDKKVEVLGREKDRRAGKSRVESVEVHEQTGKHGTTVYNIEVEGNHNYFANNVLVGNCHYLKNPDAKRTKAVVGDGSGAGGIAGMASHVWCLTGTPIKNDPADLWVPLRLSGVTRMSFPSFQKRYFKQRVGTFSVSNTVRVELLPELQKMLREMSIMRTFEDVGEQLPPIRIDTLPVDGDNTAVVEYLRQYPGLSDRIVQSIEQEQRLSFDEGTHIATLRALIAEAKAPGYAKLITEELKSGTIDKLVVMAHHRRAIQIVHEHLVSHGIRAEMIYGGTSEVQKTAIVRSFQDDPKGVRVILGNIQSAGTGLTMTAACRLDMLESSWTPADNVQAVRRIRRKGQKRPTLARFVMLQKSFDQTVAAIVTRKANTIVSITAKNNLQEAMAS